LGIDGTVDELERNGLFTTIRFPRTISISAPALDRRREDFLMNSASFVILIGVFGLFQNPATSSKSLAVPRLEKGTINGKTYRNPSIGLELTPDSSLKLQSPELRNKGSKSEILSVAALGKFKWGSAREGMFVGIFALASYPEGERSTSSCMQHVVEAQAKNGLKVVQQSSQSELGHTMFVRSDFLKEGPIYEAAFVRACDTLGLTIVFTGPDRNTIEKYIAAADLKLDPLVSGCTPR
jgi:hypothetical protein